ncbi:MAG: hypothetical protein VX839_07300, partial [Verrucomicrobiota bacterium]|nr:hypothetical protein [Verrucomicrobiota bacterium]
MKSPQFQLYQVLLQAPPGKKFLLLPIAYTLFLQIITGIPKPGTLKNIDANELLVRFSTELFDYPYWLQDLSHLPLFFALGWLCFRLAVSAASTHSCCHRWRRVHLHC